MEDLMKLMSLISNNLICAGHDGVPGVSAYRSLDGVSIVLYSIAVIFAYRDARGTTAAVARVDVARAQHRIRAVHLRGRSVD
jgi:hypothetical protein